MGVRKRAQCVCVSLVAAYSAYRVACLAYAGGGVMTTTAAYLAACGLLFASAASFDMSTKNPADSHSLKTLFLQYTLMKLMTLAGRYVYRRFRQHSRHVKRTQQRLLQRILEANALTIYGQRHGFEDIKSREEYVRSHPLTKYPHYQVYIEGIERGQENVLTKDPVVFLATSSGTTGKAKVIPITKHMKGPAAYKIGPLIFHFMDEKAGLSLQRVLIISYTSPVEHSDCGLSKGPVTQHMRRLVPYTISPPEAYGITNEQVALHVHAIFALSEPELGHIEATMSTLLYSFWMYIEHHWKDICDNIEYGIVSPYLDIPNALLISINIHLRPNPLRATELRVIFERTHAFENIAKQIWPNLRFVRMLTTGGFVHHAKVLRSTHMKGVIQVSLLHACSEGLPGFNMSADPRNYRYVALIDYGFMEFIPEAVIDKEQPDTCFAEEVQTGQCYEIVLTTAMGLYRYRLGDVVKIVDFLCECPIYEFQYRVGQTLNLYWEKTPESVLYGAVDATVSRLGLSLVDFTTTEDLFMRQIEGYSARSTLKHYVLFIELSHGGDVRLDEAQQKQFDSTLCRQFDMYATFRRSDSIGEMRVIQLTRDTFMRLKAVTIERNQNQQYKTPRVLRNPALLAFLFKCQLD